MNTPCISDETIDSRDIDKRIDYLKIGLDDTPFDVDEYSDRLREIVEETPEEWWENVDMDEVEELINWLELRDEAQRYTTEWRSGVVLVEETSFDDYAEEVARDIEAIPKDLDERYFDFETYAVDLRAGFTELTDIDGYVYLVRTT